jgi:large subunit ribosomal protein L6
VTCKLTGSHLNVTGPKGTLERDLCPEMTITIDEKAVTVARPSDLPEHRALHGLTRALISNMVVGVTQGFEKVLQIQGVGYRASLRGKSLNLTLGFSHPVTVDPPEGIVFNVEGVQTVKVSGIDKELVGRTAAKIRALRKPEPYKGKGIRYENERIRRKVGKAAVKQA